MISEKILEYIEKVDAYIEKNGNTTEVANAIFKAAQVVIKEAKEGKAEAIDTRYALSLLDRAKTVLDDVIYRNVSADVFKLEDYCLQNGISIEELDLYYKIWKEESFYIFDSYLLYLEHKREKKDRFYSTKRKQLLKTGVVQGLQDLEDDKLDILSISLPPGTGKTTLEKFFATWVIGRHPDDYSLFFSHSDDITRMFYDGVLAITTDDEYCWSEIFPGLNLQKTDASRQQLNFGKQKAFWSLQNTSIGSKNAGKVRCNRYLYCDDLIGGIEEALNINTLDKIWRIYGTDARQRRLNQQVKELIIATRWSVHDPIGRLEQIYDGSDRARFIAVPDIDPKTGESNFDYEVNGMTVEFFHDIELVMDPISYRCLYKNEPIEREGLLYHEEDLRRFMQLPLEEPDAIWGVCDTKSKGTDFLFLPCAYQYGNDFYIADCICSNESDYAVQYERISDLIVRHKMQKCEFESNVGGDRVAFEVEKLVESKGGRCHITTKPTTANKETKIIVNAEWVKKHCLFKAKDQYTNNDDYGIMMKWLLSYSVAGKNVHDDVPDGLAMLCLFVTNVVMPNKVEAVSNPFRTMTSGYGYGGYYL